MYLFDRARKNKAWYLNDIFVFCYLQNDSKKSTSSLSMLKKKLKSLGGSKAETLDGNPDDIVVVSPLRPSIDNITSPVHEKLRPSQGKDLLTPNVDSE